MGANESSLSVMDKYWNCQDDCQWTKKELNLKDPETDETLLIQACSDKNIKFVRDNLSKMSDTTIRHCSRVTTRNAIHVAIENHAEEIIQLLLKRGMADNICLAGNSPLMTAISVGEYQLATAILETGSSHPEQIYKINGETALIMAVKKARSGSSEVIRLVQMLLKTNSKPYHLDAQGWSALDYAEASELPDLIKLLIPYNNEKLRKEREKRAKQTAREELRDKKLRDEKLRAEKLRAEKLRAEKEESEKLRPEQVESEQRRIYYFGLLERTPSKFCQKWKVTHELVDNQIYTVCCQDDCHYLMKVFADTLEFNKDRTIMEALKVKGLTLAKGFPQLYDSYWDETLKHGLIVMDRVIGQSLFKICKWTLNAKSFPDFVRVFQGALQRLQVLYDHRITHGDPHFNNIIFSNDLQVYLIDFGLGQIYREDGRYALDWDDPAWNLEPLGKTWWRNPSKLSDLDYNHLYELGHFYQNFHGYVSGCVKDRFDQKLKPNLKPKLYQAVGYNLEAIECAYQRSFAYNPHKLLPPLEFYRKYVNKSLSRLITNNLDNPALWMDQLNEAPTIESL